MPKKLLKRWMPDHGELKKQKSLQVLGKRLHDPNLWHFNRRSVSGGLALGVFVAFIPLPIQMLIAATLSLWMRVNLPLAVAAVWITNPLTIPPIFYSCYRFGYWVLHNWPLNLVLELSPANDMVWSSLGAYAGPLLLGSLLAGILLALLTYACVRLAWRLHVIYQLRRRKRKLRHRNEQVAP